MSFCDKLGYMPPVLGLDSSYNAPQTPMPNQGSTKGENKHPHPAPPPSEGEGGGGSICVLNSLNKLVNKRIIFTTHFLY